MGVDEDPSMRRVQKRKGVTRCAQTAKRNFRSSLMDQKL